MIESILSQIEYIIDIETCKLCKDSYPCSHKVRVITEYNLTYDQIKELYDILGLTMEIRCIQK